MDAVKFKRISRKTREQAALICDVAASWPTGFACPWTVAEAMGIDATHDAVSLAANADGAVWEANGEPDDVNYRADYAEAAALIRDGWSTGDLVRRLRK